MHVAIGRTERLVLATMLRGCRVLNTGNIIVAVITASRLFANIDGTGLPSKTILSAHE